MFSSHHLSKDSPDQPLESALQVWLPLANTRCAPHLVSLSSLHLRSHWGSVNSPPALSFSFCFPNLPIYADLGLRLGVRGRWATLFPSFSRLIQHSINRYLLSIFYVADAGLGAGKQSESRWTRPLAPRAIMTNPGSLTQQLSFSTQFPHPPPQPNSTVPSGLSEPCPFL